MKHLLSAIIKGCCIDRYFWNFLCKGILSCDSPMQLLLEADTSSWQLTFFIVLEWKWPWLGEAFWKPKQTLNYFRAKNGVLIFSLTSALSLWQILETILGLKICRLKSLALEICFCLQAGKQVVKEEWDVAGSCWPESYCSGVTVIVELDYWHNFPSSSLPTSSKSPPCPSGVCISLLHARLAGTGHAAVSLCGLCLTWVTRVLSSYCLCAGTHKDVLSRLP